MKEDATLKNLWRMSELKRRILVHFWGGGAPAGGWILVGELEKVNFFSSKTVELFSSKKSWYKNPPHGLNVESSLFSDDLVLE